MALGLGEMTLSSYLNEPLKAQVDLLNIGGLHEDQIRIRLATTEDFKRMGVDRAYFLTSISFDVEIDDDGRARIVMSSEDPVLEPYLDFIVEARWPSGRLLREYTVLIDPPVFDESSPVISASSRVAQVEGEPEPTKKKQEAVTATGTRVELKDSTMAAGEMPTRSFNATTSPAPVPGARYMIHRDDTLWRIASQARPAGTSVNQTMLDIQRLNPDAFIAGNINLIKAGYIIYLPTESDISRADQAQAQAEVSQQNQAWLENRGLEPDYGSGPSLRISAEAGDVATSESAGSGGEAASTAAMEETDKVALERNELEQRLASMEQQLETLQRIVNLKDDQIAALQNVLSDKQSSGDAATPPATDTSATAAVEVESPEVDAESGVAVGETTGDAEPAAAETLADGEPTVAPEEVSAAAKTPPTPAPKPARIPAPEPAASVFSNLWFGLGALVLAVLGIFYMRRRRQEQEDDGLELNATTVGGVPAAFQGTEQAAAQDVSGEAPQLDERVGDLDDAGDRGHGYGEQKNDEYASDENSDALAEAEIYIAYGRYPQAIDLLQNALVTDPENAAYRLKLLQLHLETGNRSAAMREFEYLESIGDGPSTTAARAALDGSGGTPPVPGEDIATDGAGVDELMADLDTPLESDFAGLEIEEPGDISLEDELDLTADFDAAALASDMLGEDLVIATESDGMSTKLDLARAYMDMGDDDGARQILEEVAAEGNPEIKAEAEALLERIG